MTDKKEEQPLPASQARFLATHELIFDPIEKMYKPVPMPQCERD